jgi:hypothetical protein
VSSGARPVLRWIYTNRNQRLLCEVSLDSSDAVYELRLADLGVLGRTRVEQFSEPMPALLRHDQVERSLVAQGWSLEFFERRSPTLQ